jgi:hypothetical protein
VGCAIVAGLSGSCTSSGAETATVPAETEPLDAALAAPPHTPHMTEADAGTVREPEPPQTAGTGSILLDAGAAPSSKPAAGSAAPSRSTDAGSGKPSTDADTTKGKGGSSQSAGKLTAFMDVSDIPSGAEAHRCVLVELPNPEPVWVSTIHATLGNGSHHMIVDRRSPQDALILDAELCGPTMGGDASRLLIAQQHETRLNLPQGVGFLLEPKQRMFLQLHYINTTDKPFAIRGAVELELFPNSARPIEAKSVFTGSTSITLPARQAGESKHFQVFPADPPWNVFALTSHTHQLGVHATIERVPSANAPAATPLHESRDWAEPPLTVFAQPLSFDGSDGLRLTCRYMNTTDRDVRFGTGVNDEMCFMWLYYYENEQR